MSETTVAGVFVRSMTAGARHKLPDLEQILLRHGISPLSVDNPGYRVPLRNFAAVTLDLMQEMEDEFLGNGELPQALGSFNMMSRACIGAGTIKRALHRCANFWNLFNNTFTHQVLVSSGRLYYELLPKNPAQEFSPYLIESMLSTVHRFHCWLGGQFIPLQAVSLPFKEPDYSDSYRALFYAAPLKFSQAISGLQMDSSVGQFEIVQTNDALDRYLDGQNLSLLNQPKQYRATSDQVRRWLEKSMWGGNKAANLVQAAKQFGVSQQILHRRLQAENTSFKELKMQTRRDVAINLLFSNRYKVEDIATRVGFSEPSAFIRAFKAWTGVTPLQYKQRDRSE